MADIAAWLKEQDSRIERVTLHNHFDTDSVYIYGDWSGRVGLLVDDAVMDDPASWPAVLGKFQETLAMM